MAFPSMPFSPDVSGPNTYTTITPAGATQAAATPISSAGWAATPGIHYVQLTNGANDVTMSVSLPPGRPAGDIVFVQRTDINDGRVYPPITSPAFLAGQAYGKLAQGVTAICTCLGQDSWMMNLLMTTTTSDPTKLFWGGNFYTAGTGRIDGLLSISNGLQVNGGQIVFNDASLYGVAGTTTNDNALATNVGAYLSSIVALASAVPLSTNTAANVTSLSLTAGDWDVTAVVGMTGASTGTAFSIGITSSSATLPANTASGNTRADTPTVSLAGSDASLMIPAVRLSLATTTTYYMVAQSTFTVGTPSAYGRLSARRVR